MPFRTVSVLGGVVQALTTVIDRSPDDGETVNANEFITQPGGKGSSAAVATYRLSRPNPRNPNAHDESLDDGIRVRMVGAVGADESGPILKKNLIDCGVNTDGVRDRDDHPTGVANILVEAASGANRIMQYPGAAHALEPTDFLTLESLGGGVVPDLMIAFLELKRETVEQAIETASRVGVEVLLKPSPARYLMPHIYPLISHLILNQTEAVMLSPCKPEDIQNEAGWISAAAYFLFLGVKNFVITLGENGAYYSNRSGSGHVEAEKNCFILDTSGAGYDPHPV